mmetsp:Transcript_77860/g.252364  ORF Transcript_77860/g.252364 Transcript_77860/m.252364 type:complete len:434 (-) Transcript_77860:100-1401(-)
MQQGDFWTCSAYAFAQVLTRLLRLAHNIAVSEKELVAMVKTFTECWDGPEMADLIEAWNASNQYGRSIWIEDVDKVTRVSVTLGVRTLDFRALFMHCLQFQGWAVAMVEYSTRTGGYSLNEVETHVVAASGAFPNRPAVIAANSWGAKDPLVAITRATFVRALLVSIDTLEVRNGQGDPIPTPAVSDFYTSLLQADLPRTPFNLELRCIECSSFMKVTYYQSQLSRATWQDNAQYATKNFDEYVADGCCAFCIEHINDAEKHDARPLRLATISSLRCIECGQGGFGSDLAIRHYRTMLSREDFVREYTGVLEDYLVDGHIGLCLRHAHLAKEHEVFVQIPNSLAELRCIHCGRGGKNSGVQTYPYKCTLSRDDWMEDYYGVFEEFLMDGYCALCPKHNLELNLQAPLHGIVFGGESSAPAQQHRSPDDEATLP